MCNCTVLAFEKPTYKHLISFHSPLHNPLLIKNSLSVALAVSLLQAIVPTPTREALLQETVERAVRRSLISLEAPNKHISMPQIIGTTRPERHCVFVCKSAWFQDAFHD